MVEINCEKLYSQTMYSKIIKNNNYFAGKY